MNIRLQTRPRLSTSKKSHHSLGSRNECSMFTFGVRAIDCMGRIRQTIKVDGQECWTLFDTGARNTYVIPSVAQVLQTSSTPRTIRTALGGGVKETNTAALLEAEIQGHPISTHALVIDEIGQDEQGTTIEILFGALAMQQWGIRPIPDEARLDLSHYPTEFIEF